MKLEIATQMHTKALIFVAFVIFEYFSMLLFLVSRQYLFAKFVISGHSG